MKIGRGVFQWDAFERRSNRYGTFALVSHDEDADVLNTGQKVVHSDWTADDSKAFVDTGALFALRDKPVHIIAKVIETRESRHVGDIFRGIEPTTPNVGEIIDLGVGILYLQPSTWDSGQCCGEIFIGLQPNNGRSTDWFDPKKLYRLHTQTVEIEINPVNDLKSEPAAAVAPIDGMLMGPTKDGNFFQTKLTRSGE